MNTAIVGVLCSIISAILGYAAHSLRSKDRAQAVGKESGVVLTQLGYLQSSIDKVDKKIDKQSSENTELKIQLARVEASTKQAHKRIDSIISIKGGIGE